MKRLIIMASSLLILGCRGADQGSTSRELMHLASPSTLVLDASVQVVTWLELAPNGTLIESGRRVDKDDLRAAIRAGRETNRPVVFVLDTGAMEPLYLSDLQKALSLLERATQEEQSEANPDVRLMVLPR